MNESLDRRVRFLALCISVAALSACGGGSGAHDGLATARTAGARTARATAVATPAVGQMTLTQWVNPFIGTQIGNTNSANQGTGGAVGNTFPGATLPFNMVQFSPDTGYGEFYAFGGYNYDKGVIQGLSLIHSSGTGCSIQQDISMMPIVGSITASPGTHVESYQSTFSHANEQAVPGFYQVKLDNGVNNELTVTRRTGFATFTWPTGNGATMILNTGRNGVGARSAQLTLVGNDAIEGFVETGGVCGGGGYFVYFHGQFDKPFDTFGTYQGDTVTPGSRTAARAQQNGGWVHFPGGGQVHLRIGVSYVSTANAALNMTRPRTRAGTSRASRRPRSRRGTRGSTRSRSRAARRTTPPSSTPRCTTRRCTPTCSATSTASTSASTTRRTRRPAGTSTPPSRAGTSTARRCSSSGGSRRTRRATSRSRWWSTRRSAAAAFPSGPPPTTTPA